MSDKCEADDLEPGDCIWVNEFEGLACVKEVHISMGRTAITFENGKTLFFDKRRRFELSM